MTPNSTHSHVTDNIEATIELHRTTSSASNKMSSSQPMEAPPERFSFFRGRRWSEITDEDSMSFGRSHSKTLSQEATPNGSTRWKLSNLFRRDKNSSKSKLGAAASSSQPDSIATTTQMSHPSPVDTIHGMATATAATQFPEGFVSVMQRVSSGGITSETPSSSCCASQPTTEPVQTTTTTLSSDSFEIVTTSNSLGTGSSTQFIATRPQSPHRAASSDHVPQPRKIPVSDLVRLGFPILQSQQESSALSLSNTYKRSQGSASPSSWVDPLEASWNAFDRWALRGATTTFWSRQRNLDWSRSARQEEPPSFGSRQKRQDPQVLTLLPSNTRKPHQRQLSTNSVSVTADEQNNNVTTSPHQPQHHPSPSPDAPAECSFLLDCSTSHPLSFTAAASSSIHGSHPHRTIENIDWDIECSRQQHRGGADRNVVINRSITDRLSGFSVEKIQFGKLQNSLSPCLNEAARLGLTSPPPFHQVEQHRPFKLVGSEDPCLENPHATSHIRQLLNLPNRQTGKHQHQRQNQHQRHQYRRHQRHHSTSPPIPRFDQPPCGGPQRLRKQHIACHDYRTAGSHQLGVPTFHPLALGPHQLGIPTFRPLGPILQHHELRPDYPQYDGDQMYYHSYRPPPPPPLSRPPRYPHWDIPQHDRPVQQRPRKQSLRNFRSTKHQTELHRSVPISESVKQYRLRQIAIAKGSIEYKSYIANCSKEQRTKNDPTTPRCDASVSCGIFNKEILQWKKSIERKEMK